MVDTILATVITLWVVLAVFILVIKEEDDDGL